MLPLHRLTFWLWFVVTPHLIACIGSVGPDKVTVFIQCSFRCCISICETHLVQTLWYCSVATVVSNALKLAFSSMVVIWWFAYMGWLRHPSFHLWMVIWNVAYLSGCCCHCWNTPPTALLCSHPLFCLHKCSASVNECHFFCKEKFHSAPLLHTHFHVRCLLPDYPSAAICHMATNCNEILVVRLNLYCHITNTRLCHHGPT